MTSTAYAAPEPMTGGKLVLATIFVALAGFMVILDTTIANVSIPTIAGALAVSPSQGTWVVTSYSVADAIVVPLTGWLVARFGTVRLFVTALLGFVGMSMLCGFARSLETLVVFRVLQGIAGAPLISLSQSMLYSSYPREKVATGQAVFAMTTIIGPILGPLLGGYISDNYSWPWIFYINVPVGLGAAWAVWQLFKTRETPTNQTPVDRMGLALLVLAVGALQLLLDKGKELDWFGSSFIVTLAVVAVIGFVLLIAWELTDKNPIVDLRLFTNRNYAIAVATLALIYGIFFGSVVLVPQWLQGHMGYSAFAAGMATAPNGILAVLLAPFIARMSGRVDARWLVTFSLLIFMLTFAMRAAWTTDVDYAHIVTPQIIQGIAMACFFMPLSQISLGSLRPEQIAMGAGLQNFARTAMAAFAASLATTLVDNQSARHHAQLAEHINPYSQPSQAALQHYADLGLTAEQGLALINRTVDNQAIMLALNDYFAWSLPLFALLLGLIWISKPTRAGAPAGTGH